MSFDNADITSEDLTPEEFEKFIKALAKVAQSLNSDTTHNESEPVTQTLNG